MKRQKYLILIIIIAAIVAGTAFYLLNQKKSNCMNEKEIAFKLETDSLLAQFLQDEVMALKTYNDKIVEIKGIVKDKEFKDGYWFVYLGDSSHINQIQCKMLSTQNFEVEQLKINQKVTIRGYCIGYLLDILFNQAIITKEEPMKNSTKKCF
jgi:hypothetical protein